MKTKLLLLGLVLTSLIGYLEWGQQNTAFLFQVEWDVLTKLFTNPSEIIHPFIILPMAGQLLLLINFFKKNPVKWLSYFGISGIGFLFLFILFIGIISLNYKIAISVLPFILLSIVLVLHHYRSSNKEPNLLRES